MCQSCDIVQISLILQNNEPWMLSATGELDGEPIRLDAACIDPVSIAGALYDFGRVLDTMRLGHGEGPVT